MEITEATGDNAYFYPINSKKKYIILAIAISQFAGTSLWFAGNAVMEDLSKAFQLSDGAVGNLTSAVQFGFILGTLVFAVTAIADRYSPSKVFLISAGLGAVSNAMILVYPFGMESLVLYRFFTGFFLAGIYPVGMKIAADWYTGDLGKALGYLVGALVIGTGFPHFIQVIGADFHWSYVLISVSLIAGSGGVFLYLMVPDGPERKVGVQFRIGAIAEVFKIRKFRLASLGYFGHMWELYAFWAFIPFMLKFYSEIHPELSINISVWSFLIIAFGFVGCVVGGIISVSKGSAKVAFVQLAISLVCCILSPFTYAWPPVCFYLFLLIWGITVVGDSPQYSALTAKTAPKEWIGSALTIMNCIGFALTIGSLQLMKYTTIHEEIQFAHWVLIPGPIIGLMALQRFMRESKI